MDIEKLSKWTELLLDTGKRNNLINFKAAKLGSAEIVLPEPAEIFKIDDNRASEFEVFDPDPDAFDYEDGRTVGMRRAEYIRTYGHKLKRNQVLLFNKDNTPVAALKNIRKKAQSAIEETGVNIAYAAYGFINWTESGESSVVMQAPLLLAPVTIYDESSAEPMRIRIADDDTVVNPTFAFKLQSEYGIALPELEDDVPSYLKQVSALVEKLGWRLSYECRISVFSFLKINMYRDLKDNAQKVVQNPAVRVLLGEPVENGAVTAVAAAQDPELHNVVDADSSQEEAVLMAKSGRSFVLQGPPGTGKSQTITNIIAECLADGKKVLFVSEKLAALSVVYEKLKRAGLEEFCLELHSHKANKKEFINELCKTLTAPKSGVSERAKREVEVMQRTQGKLDAYAEELHKVRPKINRTLYGIFDELSCCRLAPDADYVISDITDKGEEYIDGATGLLERYVGYIPSIGYDYKQNVWYGYNRAVCTYEDSLKLKVDMQSVTELVKKLEAAGAALDDKYRMNINSLARVNAAVGMQKLFTQDGFATPELFTADLDEVTASVKKMQTLANTVNAQKELLGRVYDDGIYALDGVDMHKKLVRKYGGALSRLFGKEYKRMISDLRLCKKDGKKIKYKAAVAHAEALSICQTALKDFYTESAFVRTVAGVAYNGVDTDFYEFLRQLKALADAKAAGVDFSRLAALSRDGFRGACKEFLLTVAVYRPALAVYGDAVKRVTGSFDADAFSIERATYAALTDKMNGCLNNIEKLDNHCAFVSLYNSLKSYGAVEYLDYALEKGFKPEQIVPAYKKLFYKQWADCIIRNSPVCAELSRVPHDEAVKLFKEKDVLNFDINKARIKSALSQNRPSLDLVAPGSAVAKLLREGEKKRKQKSVRLLMSEIGDLIQTIKPCFLMSPLSVSTFLSADMTFDTVVFDEASQIFPQDAVGAIYRGKQLIVVGDSKQMPPSNFFNTVADPYDDDESVDDDVTDFESVLDICATAFPQRRLKWHYRSRAEELIAFSNKNFYGNDLVTFPTAKKGMRASGVEYFYVNGTFDRKSKTNRKEAERIVDMVFEHIEKFPDRSLGVVAFSVAQQTLIERLISRRRRDDLSKEAFFRSDGAEPFFVKNLETVQGDERDTIIFSVAYGRDEGGKLLLNFGPVNREGGERRLNVAVTRAKINVRIVSSMHYTDIDLSRTRSEGARLLREYLDYAENGATALGRSLTVPAFDDYDSEFEREVCEFLRSKGFSADTQVGCSSFRIDIALKRPDTSDYVLAIECDGASYHSTRAARDRDRLRQQVLEGMGWKFYRIWSTDWFRNKPIEQQRLETAAREALAAAPKPTAADKAAEAPQREKPAAERFEEIAPVVKFKFPVYKQAGEREIAQRYKGSFVKTVCAILKSEAPISEEWLLKRIAFLFGRDKVTVAVKRDYEVNLWRLEGYGIVRRNGFLYFKDTEVPMLRVPAAGSPPREIKYICAEELANGLRKVLMQNVTAEKTGLFKLIAQQLGFARAGEAIMSKLDEALGLLKSEIVVKGETVRLK